MEKLSRARVELEEGRRILVEKQIRVQEVAKATLDSGHKHGVGFAESVLAILKPEQDLDSDSETGDMPFGAPNGERRDAWALHADGRFVGDSSTLSLSSLILPSQSLTDSLSVALSEDLTPTFQDRHSQTPSPALSFTPPDAEPPDRDSIHRTKPATRSLTVSSGSLFSPSIDDLVSERDGSVSPAEAFSKSRTPSPLPLSTSLPPPQPRAKRRANTSAPPASMTSSTSKGLGDWMGWFGKGHLRSQTRDRSVLENAIAEDTTPDPDEHTEVTSDKRADGKPLGSHPQKPEPAVKQTKEDGATMRLATGVLNAFRTGSPSSPQPTPSSTAAPPKASLKLKNSTSILDRSVSPSVLSSPILSAFMVPPPRPAPPVAVSVPVSARVPLDSHNDDERRVSMVSASVVDGEAVSVLSSGPSPKDKEVEEAGHVQGSSLRALSNATRVMTSDPASILVDHGQDVGELVTGLAWELVRGVRDRGVTFKEPVKSKSRAKPPPPGEYIADGDEDQPGVPEGKLNPKGMMVAKNLAVLVGEPGGTAEKVRKVGALGTLASPRLVGLSGGSSKARASSTSLRDEIFAGPTIPTVGPSGPSVPIQPATSTAGALSVPLESIIPATAKPPTQYLARTYTSLISPDFKPPTSFGGFASDRFATRKDAQGSEPITDRYGFVYEVSSYDVLLLDRALRANNSGPGCLTGIKVADREEDDDWPVEDNTEWAKEFEVARGSCDCVDGLRASDVAQSDERGEHDAGNAESEAASMVSTSSSKRSSNRITDGNKPPRTISLSTPLKIASLEYLPSLEEDALVPTHACPNTVRALVARLTDAHDQKQARLKSSWDAFLRARRDMKPIKASTPMSTRPATSSSGAAAMLGLGSHGAEDDVEELRQSEGLVGFSQMGLASNQNERREFGRLVRGGIPLVYRAKVWLECSGALEMAEPGAFKDLLESSVKEDGVAIGEIEKDVGRTMPLNVFFGGDGVGVDKLRRVLRAYSW